VSDAIYPLVDHLFRHSAGRMVARLTSILGSEHLSLAEEVVQDALVSALQQWSFRGVPDDPTAWLFHVARNKAIDQLRRSATLREKEPQIVAVLSDTCPADESGFAHELADDELRMMLMCCHPAIPEEGRIALTLKTVCAFSVDEIARAFLSRNDTIAQRIVRAKRLIREERIAMSMPSRDELPARRESLLKVLYLMFNEGYSAHTGENLVRSDLCAEAVRLARAVAEHPVASSPEAHALLALMLLQSARLPARIDSGGELIVLAEQDRSKWDRPMIADGMQHLDLSASGDVVTRYHTEAAIAACHATAPSFDETDWRSVVELYDELLATNPSPVVALNRAIALAMADGPAAGVAAVEEIADSLHNYLPLATTLGELSLRAGDRIRAAEYFARALELPSTTPEKRFLLRKLEQCRNH
jgi:RNA polymerase sigma-70 factor (ECF subfamily)